MSKPWAAECPLDASTFAGDLGNRAPGEPPTRPCHLCAADTYWRLPEGNQWLCLSCYPPLAPIVALCCVLQ